MGVDVQCERGAGVSQLLGDDLWRNSYRQCQRRCRVAEIVKSDFRQTRSIQNGLEMLVRQTVEVYRFPELSHEYKVLGLWAFRRIDYRLIRGLIF